MSRRSLSRALRWISVGALPAVLLALYFTHSRGGILTLIVGAGTLIVLSRDRLWYLATLLIAAVLPMPAILASPPLPELSNNYDFPPIVDQGLEVGAHPARSATRRHAARLLGACAGSSAGDSPPVTRALEISRDRRVLGGIAIVGLVVVLIAGVALRRHRLAQVHQLRPRHPAKPASAKSRATAAVQFWDVGARRLRRKAAARPRRRHLPVLLGPAADDRHAEHPGPLALPAGARRAGDRRRRCSPSAMVLIDARGSASRPGAHASGRERELYAVLLGVSLAFAVGVAYDWFWQLAMVGSVFFMATGTLVAARCGQIWRARAIARAREGVDIEAGQEGRRFGLAIAGLAVAWLTMLALIGPLLVDHEIHASNSARPTNGELESAVSHAEDGAFDRALGGHSLPAARPPRPG